MCDLASPGFESKTFCADAITLANTPTGQPALGVSVRSVRLVAIRLGFYSRSGHTKDFKSRLVFAAYRQALGTNGSAKGLVYVCCSFCMFSNSVQSFTIDICNGPPIEYGLHNVCLAPTVRYLYSYRPVLELLLPQIVAVSISPFRTDPKSFAAIYCDVISPSLKLET